jgi:tyrosine-protein phosphatase SIW14
MFFKKRAIFLTVVSLVFLFYCSSGNKTEATGLRPEQWATVMAREGIPNFYKVSPALYRGGQPDEQGFDALKKLGIKTIVNFRLSNKDQKLFNGYGFNYYHLPMIAFFPKKNKFRRFLEIVSDPVLQPVFVHCQYGADRTGAAVALYRIKIQKWEVEKAIDEMLNGGYHFHRIHSHLKRFIRNFRYTAPAGMPRTSNRQ